MELFDEIYIWNESNLNPDFREKFKDKLVPGVRGYGYWCWKAQIILQVLERLEEDDLLCYADTGCHLNPKGRSRMEAYYQMTQNSASGILTFEGPWTDGNWSKGDLLKHLNVLNEPSITHTGTRVGTTFFIKKTTAAVNLVRAWKSIYEYDFSLIDDTQSNTPNLPGFVEHRHDQSIFSILCKQHKAEKLPYQEINTQETQISTAPTPNINPENQPILAKKDWSPCHPFKKFMLKIAASITPIRSYRRMIRSHYQRHVVQATTKDGG